MRLLLDTHALLWSAHEPDRLSVIARQVIEDGSNEIIVSAVSAMEIATKSRKGTLEYPSTLARRFTAEVERQGFGLLAITSDHAQRAGGFVDLNKDPWDRLLAAQALIEGLTLVTCDERMHGFGAPQLW